jgi:2-dehydro-3-deoxyphosphogluconate aldolase/(4S)-4-hydroxy-2-oxoglutarate aldolase
MIQRILTKRILPAAIIDRLDDAVPLAEALLAGGLDIIEITFRTEAAAESIRQVSKKFPEMLVGAGTVLTDVQLARAIDAGAKFCVAPGLNPELILKSDAARIPFVPGVATPTEVDRAINAGCQILKFFPAEALGGVKMLKALAGPFAHTGVKFIPTGGVDGANAKTYLDLPIVAAVGGSWMLSPALIKAKNWAEITRLTREALALVG